MGLTERALRELMRILETGKFPSDDSAASDLYFAVREALENRRILSDRTAERDHLRAELIKVLRFVGGQATEDVSTAFLLNVGEEVSAVLASMTAMTADLRAEVERLRGELDFEKAENDFGCGGVRSALRSSTARAEAAESTVAGLRRALEEVRCRCSRGIDNHCPECGDDLDRVVNNGPLNDDQFDAVKAGDWYCKKCKSDAAATGFKYWLDRQLPVVVYQTCDRCAALAATSDEHERRIKAEARAVADRYQKADDAAVQLLEKAKLTLEVPAAEYVPAISDAWQLIENALEKIR